MADNNQLLEQIRKVVREENEPLKQGQAGLETAVDAVAAGQVEIKETMATKADVLSVGVKVDKLRKRVEGIEEHTGSPTSHKN